MSVPSRPAKTTLYLLRHAEVEVAYHRVFGGTIDMALSPFGRKQAVHLADFMQRHPVDALYGSPMKRAQETLQPLAQRLDLSPVVLDGLREVDFGIWTGLSWDEVWEQHQIEAHRWLHQIDQRAIPKAECPAAWRERVAASLNRILTDQPGKAVAVVCHGGVIRMALSILLELPLIKTSHFDVEYASVTWVQLHAHKSEIRLLNYAPWEHAE